MADFDMKEMGKMFSAFLAGTVLELDGSQTVMVPSDFQMHSLDHLQTNPIRAKNNRRMDTTQSFLDYISFYEKGRDSAVYVDIDNRSMHFIINHSSVDEDGASMPDWEDNTAHYALSRTREWEAWLAHADSSMSQRDFADFLEDRREDVKDPDATMLLEMVDSFRVVQNMDFKASQRRATGEHAISFSKENQSGTVDVPEEITLAIAPFVRGPAYSVKVRLKYRVKDAVLAFSFSVVNSELIEDDALDAEVAKVIDLDLGIPHYYGKKQL